MEEKDMRKLNELYWDKFTKSEQDGTIKRDGIIFEDLVECLLQIEYGHQWIRTPKSHDNNRDFHLTTLEFTYWAECKNYNNVIALDTIAPTLVMAQIFDVNKLIFFSYSDINFSAKAKVFSFGTKTGKEIEIFDGDSLDNLIIKSGRFLPEKFRPLDKHVNYTKCRHSLYHSFYFIQNPILGVNSKDRDIKSIPNVEKIIYNTIFEIAFVCTNNTIENGYKIEISLDNILGKDNAYFTLVDYELENISAPFPTKSIPKAGGIVNRYFFKSNRFKPSLMLPVFQVVIWKNEEIIDSFHSPIHIVNNQWIGKTILIGEKYRTTVKLVEKNVLNNDKLSCFMSYGASGTGKTRLLKEILDILLKHRYRIISFIGNEEDSAYMLLKELIYFVYEVPRDEILRNLEEDIFIQNHTNINTPVRQAYLLAQRFSTSHTDSELIEIINDSFDLLYEKISKERIAIVIDNIQFFGDAMIFFLQKYILYSKHQSRKNSSVLILSVNQDYITDKATELLDYIQDLSKDRKQIVCCNVTGFSEKNQGVLFLRELFHIDNDSLDPEFEIILNKSSLKPYYIYQAVYYLYEEGVVLETDEEKGYFPCLEKFHDAIDNMPSQIKEIISKRWGFFLRHFNSDEDAIIIIASVFLFRELDPKIIALLELDNGILKAMNKHMFLKLNENRNYCFDHDIIEHFFVTFYYNLEQMVIDRIKKCRIARKLTDYPFVNSYYRLYSKKLTPEKLQSIYDKTLTVNIPSKLIDIYYSKFLKQTLNNQTQYKDSEYWMSMVFGICNLAKNSIGIKKAEKYFETVNDFLGSNISERILLTNAYRNYMNIYADLLFFQKRHADAIIYLEKIRNIPTHSQTDQVYALKSMIYNRLLINHRELPSNYHQAQSKKCLISAISYANMLEDISLKNEFSFLNISDEGYYYYCMYNEKEKLLSIWKRCMEYPPERLPQKAMNYYRKCLQINLIEQKFQRVYDIIYEALEYMEVHYSSSMEKINFNLSFSLYKIMALIQENPVENNTRLLKEINHALELSKLMAKRNLYQIFVLKAIVCFYNKDREGTYYQYKEAYRSFKQKHGALFYKEKNSLMLANIYVSFYQFDMLSKAKDFLSDIDREEFDTLNICLSDYEAYGIQRTSDKLFNLPCV